MKNVTSEDDPESNHEIRDCGTRASVGETNETKVVRNLKSE